jgi:hypothetical protein
MVPAIRALLAPGTVDPDPLSGHLAHQPAVSNDRYCSRSHFRFDPSDTLSACQIVGIPNVPVLTFED